MPRLFLAATALFAAGARAQSIDDLKLQVHGYGTQSFLYSNHNSWNSTDSENGSASWSEAVVNVSAQPQPKLRIGVQARFFLLGDTGNSITLDWAQADYKLDDRFGARFGKVKTPVGLYNDSQDIDPAHLWALLPQSIYPLASRNSDLAHFGGVLYGKFTLGEHTGSLEYRGFGGQRVLAAEDGEFQPLRDAGFAAPNGTTGPVFGGTLRWNAPIAGLSVGASELSGSSSGELEAGPVAGTLKIGQLRQTYYFAQYDHNRILLAGEFSRSQAAVNLFLPGAFTMNTPVDREAYYGMASYRVREKLNAGMYFSSFFDHKAPLGPSRFQKDWTLAVRYDFNSYLYAKAEQHFLDGTALNYSAGDNPEIRPDSRLTLLKIGFSF